MSVISNISERSGAELPAGELRTVVTFCCFGLMVSLCLMTFGMDLSAGWL